MIEAVQLPMGFRRIHAADLIGWNCTISHSGFKQLLIDINSIIGRQRHPHATASLHPFPEPALKPVPPELEKSDSMRSVAWTTDASGVTAGETASVAAADADNGPVDFASATSASSAADIAWDAAAVEAIENDLTYFIGPVAKVVVRRAMRDTTDFGSLCTAVARSIPLDADRRHFLTGANNLAQSRPLPTVNSGAKAATSSSGSARECPDPLTADVSLSEIEQALAHHIGPIAKLILKRARAQSGTRDELFEHLATHIEREDERRQFFAAITRRV
jgi:hypothetical protein